MKSPEEEPVEVEVDSAMERDLVDPFGRQMLVFSNALRIHQPATLSCGDSQRSLSKPVTSAPTIVLNLSLNQAVIQYTSAPSPRIV
jgi:hypothetical protein